MIEKKFKVYVLRLGHRPARDKRVTTHVCLVARAFGADGVVLADVIDETIKKTMGKVINSWGGKYFNLIMGINHKKYIKEWKKKGGIVIHLTMYGVNIDEVIEDIRRINKDMLIVVGAEKVPRDIYELADFNIAVGHQPHSEVAALAIFLDRLFEGKELMLEFKDAKLKIIPQRRGKKVIKVT